MSDFSYKNVDGKLVKEIIFTAEEVDKQIRDFDNEISRLEDLKKQLSDEIIHVDSQIAEKKLEKDTIVTVK